MPASETRAEAVVLDPGAGTATVTRVEYFDNGDTQTEQVTYVVEQVGNWVKFEDAPVGLGEDYAVQADTFRIRVENGGDSVTVVTKAARNLATSISGVGDTHVDENGFEISLLSIVDGVYTIRVKSVSAQYALSHVDFTFSEGNYAEPTYD